MVENSQRPFVHPSETANGERPGRQESSKFSHRSWVDTLVNWIWEIIAFVPNLITSLVKLMVTPGTTAAVCMGGVGFLCGIFMSADSYFQLWGGGQPLFPFFETNWLGWGWFPSIDFSLIPFKFRLNFGIFTNGVFLFSVALSSIVQMIQSVTFRSFTAKVKTSVKGFSPKTIGLIAYSSWVFDFILAFTSRNPFIYDDPSMRLSCAAYVIFSVFAAEIGYTVFMLIKETKE